MRLSLFFIFFLCAIGLTAQSYDSYFTGNETDIVTSPRGGVCLMGGATEDDEAMKWFLQRADGGDVLVLRASGSNGYNNYLFSELGININSVESIVFNDGTAADENYIHEKIAQAEAIWMAGGNQWNYVNYWRNTAIDSLINDAILNRSVVVGGTSAGMAVQGGFYFSAENGTVTSANAMANPYNNAMTVDSTTFLKNAYLSDVVTDTHFDDPDRKGRTVTFLARIFKDYGISAKAIACDEYTAVCIDTDGIAQVYGGYPNYDDNAYFVQVNCEVADPEPENCTPGNSLEWNHNGAAIKVYAIKGTADGSNFFNLNDWESGTGGTWHNWSVENGSFMESESIAANCLVSSTELISDAEINIYPNPTEANIHIESSNEPILSLTIFDAYSRRLQSQKLSNLRAFIDISSLPSGVYFLEVETNEGTSIRKLIKQ